MVDEFSSDQEQVEAIKKWLKAHGPSIVAGIVIGLGAIGGWRFWTHYQLGQSEQASARYQTLTQALADDDISKALGQAAVLKDDYADSNYGALAAFALAKVAAGKGDYPVAAEELEWIIGNDQQTDMQPIARIRLARVKLAQAELDEATDLLGQVTGDGFTAEAEELKGDIFAARDQTEQARTAYQAALAAGGGGSSLLQLKLDNLPPAASE